LATVKALLRSTADDAVQCVSNTRILRPKNAIHFSNAKTPSPIKQATILHGAAQRLRRSRSA
jgi:hypothetical protein